MIAQVVMVHTLTVNIVLLLNAINDAAHIADDQLFQSRIDTNEGSRRLVNRAQNLVSLNLEQNAFL